MNLEVYALAALAVVLTGVSKSGFAGGLGILGVPLLALKMPPQDAAVLLLPVLIGIDVLAVCRYRGAWDRGTVRALLPGAFVGIGLGALSFAHIDADTLRIAVGLMALAFVAHRLLGGRRPPTDPRTKPGMVFLASTVSGFAGFLAHAGGPPIKGTLLSLQLDKTAFVGTNSVFFFVLNLAKAVGYGGLGLISASSLWSSLSLVPFLVLGVFLGFRLHNRISQNTFVALAYGLLGLAGLNLLYMGFSARL